MKRNLHFFLLLLFACVGTSLSAQLPNGSIAPDWTLTDINGDTYNLYDELDDGKSIILDIAATWCPPCWSYHNSGVLEELYEDYGPDGTDQIRVFMVEGEDATNLNCLYGTAGCNNSTLGDWVTGTDYPIFSPEPAEANTFINDYQLGFWPTLYGISPIDKTTQLLGQASYSEWESWLIDSWNMSAATTIVDSDCPYMGMVDVEMTYGYGDIEFEWSNGETSEDLMNVPAGTYAVTITDENDVSITLENLVVVGTEAAALTVADVDYQAVDCNGNSTGSLQVIASGGSGSFNYIWSNGMAGSFIDNLPDGEYVVTCTDGTGCTTTKAYTVEEPEELISGSSVTSTACGEENGLASLSGQGGILPYTYDIGFGSQNSSDFPSLAPGAYNAMITDANGCISEQAFIIEESVAPQALAEASSAINCNISEVSVTAANSSYIGNVDYIWATADGVITTNTESESITVTAAGTYSLTLIETSTGCISASSVVVEDNSQLPTVSIANVEEINCTINQVTIDGSASDAGDHLVYAWTTSDGNITGSTDETAIEVDLGGTYTLNITNMDSGCISSQSVNVTADTESPLIEVTSGVLTCATPEVEICATVALGHSVVWSSDAGDIAQTCITVVVVGDYTATVSAPNGCTNSTVSIVTASNDLPIVSVAMPSVLTCTQEEVQLIAVIEGGSTNDIITWSDNNGNLVAQGPNQIMVSNPGIYEVAVTNTLGCTTVIQVAVEQDINTPIASFDYSVDVDGVVTLNSTSNDGGSVSWQLADGTLLTGEDAVFTVAEGGAYQVCMTYDNECGSDENCQTVVYSTLLVVSTDKTDLTCYQSADGSISATVSGGASGYIYSWIGPNGFQSTNQIITDLSAGIYTLIVSDDDGTEISSEVSISEPEELNTIQESLTNTTCNGNVDGSIQFTMVGGISPYIYTWSDGAVIPNRSDLAVGDYTLNVIDGNGCSFTKSYVINEPAAISITSLIISEEEDGLSNGTINMEVDGGTGNLTYEWSNGATTANLDNLATGEYSVVITDANGCSFTQAGIMVGTITDVSNLEVVADFKMYPVPASTSLNVDVKLNSIQVVKMNILDATGKLIWARSFQSSTIQETVSLTSFVPGIYSLSMMSAGNIQSENFIVIK